MPASTNRTSFLSTRWAELTLALVCLVCFLDFIDTTIGSGHPTRIDPGSPPKTRRAARGATADRRLVAVVRVSRSRVCHVLATLARVPVSWMSGQAVTMRA
jgi:hypothetical protein